MLVAEAIQHSQIRGRNGQLVDPKPEQGENGEIKIKLSQQLIKDIFEQYPIVAKVYNDNVPEPVSLLYTFRNCNFLLNLSLGGHSSQKENSGIDTFIQSSLTAIEVRVVQV